MYESSTLWLLYDPNLQITMWPILALLHEADRGFLSDRDHFALVINEPFSFSFNWQPGGPNWQPSPGPHLLRAYSLQMSSQLQSAGHTAASSSCGLQSLGYIANGLLVLPSDKFSVHQKPRVRSTKFSVHRKVGAVGIPNFACTICWYITITPPFHPWPQTLTQHSSVTDLTYSVTLDIYYVIQGVWDMLNLSDFTMRCFCTIMKRHHLLAHKP